MFLYIVLLTGDVATKYGMGWIPDLPDHRDFTSKTDTVQTLLKKMGVENPTSDIPTKVDLRQWFSPIENQARVSSCTANAGVGLLEYYERRAFGKYTDASRLFLYKVTRNLMGTTEDSGAELRTTMGAMVLFGICPEKYWPYVPEAANAEPPTFCYSFAQNYKAVKYVRLDPPSATPPELLSQIKTFLAAGLPSIFGFTVFDSIKEALTSGKIPFPGSNEARLGGHAVVAVGYDDEVKIKSSDPSATETKGAFIIRNSWGEGWGETGYGYLPYEYVLQGVADDWWTLLANEWVDTEIFGL